MDRFDRYYKSRNLKANENLINKYVKYDNETLLISNGFGVVYTKKIRSDFKDITNTTYGTGLKRHYDNFSSKENELMMTLDYENIKNNLIDGVYRFSRDYSLDYLQLKKIIDIIGCVRISVLSRDDFNSCFIEIIGKNNQVGYLLPCRVY